MNTITSIEIETGKSEHGTPYRSLVATVEPAMTIEIRQYPSNTFLSFADDSDNMSTGCDIEDAYICSQTITHKVPNWLFEQKAHEYVKDIFTKIGYNGNAFTDEVNAIVAEWRK